jgi:hypothetical protein
VISLDRSTAARVTLVARCSLGAASLVAPRLTIRMLQLDPEPNPSAEFLIRIFGVRDIFLGVAPFLISDPGRGTILGSATGVDLTDLAAAALAGLTGRIPPRAAVVTASAALLGAVLSAATVGRGPLGRRENPGTRGHPAGRSPRA